MADRYWVGGTGTWNTTSTTNWSATSGGAGGASVPTAADNVIFDSATTYTVTMTGALTCLNFTVSAGTVTFAQGTSPTLTISGNLSLIAATVWNMTGTVTFNATTSKTIGINNVLFAPVDFNGAAGTWTLTSAAQFRGITLTNGTFSTSASNYSIDFYNAGFTIAANSNNKTLLLNGSTITIRRNFINNSTGNFTLNAGTSTIVADSNLNGVNTSFYTTQNLTFYNFTCSSSLIPTISFTISDSSVVYTFNNFTISGATGNLGDKITTIPANDSTTNMVINGTLTMRGTSVISGSRVVLRGQDYTNGNKTQAKISAASVSFIDVDFYCINNTGVSAWTGARLGNIGNNTNITTTPSKTVYYKTTNLLSLTSSNVWSNTSGGTTSINNAPLIQDVAIIDNNSGNGTLSLASVIIGTINAMSRTTSMNISFGVYPSHYDPTIFGSYIVSSNVTHIRGVHSLYRSTITFAGLENSIFNPNSSNLLINISVAKANANVNMSGNITTNGTTYLTCGNLNLEGDLTVDSFSSSSPFIPASVRNINFGNNKKIVIFNNTSAGSWQQYDATNFSYTGIPNVFFTTTGSTAPTIQTPGAGITGNNLVDFYFTGGTYTLDLSSYQNFGGLDFTGSSANLTGVGGGSFNVYGFFKLSSSVNILSMNNGITFKGANGKTNIISFKGKTWPNTTRDVQFDGETGTSWKIFDSVNFDKNLDHYNGTIDLNANTLTCLGYQTYTGAKNLTFNGGTLSCNGSFNNDKPDGFTVTQGTGTGKISMISGPSKSFIGGSNNYSGVILSQAGEGTLTVSGSNSFEDITNDYKNIGATTISFTSGTTQTVNNFTANGSIGKLLTINGTTTGRHATLSKSSGAVYVEYVNLKDNRATGGATWRADNSTNQGNVVGWYPWIGSFLAFF